jgi:hypothetical protein
MHWQGPVATANNRPIPHQGRHLVLTSPQLFKNSLKGKEKKTEHNGISSWLAISCCSLLIDSF